MFTFSSSRADLGEMRERLYERLRDAVLRADESSTQADEADEAVQASAVVCFVETPEDLPWRPRRR